MRINNEYIICWDSETRVVTNKDPYKVDKEAMYSFPYTIEFFATDDYESILKKIKELNLIVK